MATVQRPKSAWLVIVTMEKSYLFSIFLIYEQLGSGVYFIFNLNTKLIPTHQGDWNFSSLFVLGAKHEITSFRYRCVFSNLISNTFLNFLIWLIWNDVFYFIYISLAYIVFHNTLVCTVVLVTLWKYRNDCLRLWLDQVTKICTIMSNEHHKHNVWTVYAEDAAGLSDYCPRLPYFAGHLFFGTTTAY